MAVLVVVQIYAESNEAAARCLRSAGDVVAGGLRGSLTDANPSGTRQCRVDVADAPAKEAIPWHEPMIPEPRG